MPRAGFEGAPSAVSAFSRQLLLSISTWTPLGITGGEGMRYIAYAVDALGVASATYQVECIGDEDATDRARELLEAHMTIELWQGYRRVTRLTRDNS